MTGEVIFKMQLSEYANVEKSYSAFIAYQEQANSTTPANITTTTSDSDNQTSSTNKTEIIEPALTVLEEIKKADIIN